ncbi:MAG TPA: ATP synthase subunit I, partial [Bacillales bacterium]|nr:ATP synthase subunit I [Bacillales bacterium]
MTNNLAEWALVRRLTLILSCSMLAILILLWFVIPAKPFVAGLILGGLISLYNVLSLARRVRVAGQLAAAGSSRVTGAGLLNRMLMVVFGILLVY